VAICVDVRAMLASSGEFDGLRIDGGYASIAALAV
jgi:hypothetical protein